MERSQRVLGSIIVFGLTVALFAPLAAAQTTYDWDAGVTGGPNDGSGTWNLTGSNWWTGTSDVLWPNTSSYTAQFGAGSGGSTAYSVTLAPAGVTAGGITFQNQAYTLTGSTLTLGGSTPTVTVNAGVGTIASPIAGTGGLTKVGAGTLTLYAVNSYRGSTVVSAGVLQLGSLIPVLPAAPLARYPFDGNTNDASGNGNDLTLANGPATYTAGQFGQAITLTGSNQYLTAPYNSSLALSSFTVSTWVNVNASTLPAGGANGGGPTLFSTRNGGDTTFDLQYYQPSAGVYQLHADVGTGGVWLNTAVNYNLPAALTGWNLITLEVSSAGYTYFVNGGQAATGGIGGTPLLMTAVEVLSMGAQEAGGTAYGSGGYLQGSLDEANIFSGNLTSAQVLALYQGQIGQLPVTPLVVSGGTLDLNGVSQQATSLSGSGAVTNSASGSSATLTLTSTATGISTYSGTIGNGAGTVSLLLSGTQGSGEFLSGVNTFTGSVSVAENASGHYSSLVLANSGALLGATLINANGVIFDKSVNPSAFTIGGLSGVATLTLACTNSSPKRPVALSVGANNQNTTFSGEIAHGSGMTGASGGSLIKVGSGTLTLTGVCSYSGGTFINGGELCPDQPLAIPNLITFGGGALQYDANSSGTDYSGNIFYSSGPIAIDTNSQPIYFGTTLDSSNTGGLTKLGASTLYLTISNAYSGPTTISGGTLNVSDPGAIPSGSTITFAGGTLQFSNTVDYSSAPYGIVNSTGPIAIDTNGYNMTFAGVLNSSNSGGLTKYGAGTLVLAASNAYSGTTTVAGGLLQLANQAGIPDNTALNAIGGTLDLGGFNKSFPQASTFQAGGTVTNSGSSASTISLSATSNGMTIASLLTDGASPLGFSVSSLGGSNGQLFDFTNPNNTFSGGVNLSNAAGRMIGSSTSSAYMGTGTITISNSGFLMLWANTGSYAGSVTIRNNFVLNTIGGWQIPSENAIYPNGTKAAIFADGDAGGAQKTILTGSIDLASNGGVDAYNGGNPNSLYISGPIYGPGALVKGIDASNGGGLVTLANTANSYAGGTVINTGTLAIMADGSLGAGNTITFGANGTLQAANSLVLSANRQILIPSGSATLNSQNFTFVVPGTISGPGALTIAGGTSGVVVLSGTNTYGGGTFINSGELNPKTVSALPQPVSISFGGGALQYTAGNLTDYSPNFVNSTGPIAIDTNGQTVTFNSSLASSNVGGLNKLGAGTLVLNAFNYYSGTTTISGGTLSPTNAGAIPGAIAFAGGTLQYSASNTVDYSSALYGIVNSSGPIAIDTNGQSVTFASPIASSNVGGLTKIGAGVLTFTANNLYSGLTTVSGGTLQLGDGVANIGSVLGNINNNSALVFANPSSQIFAGAVSGSGSVTKTGAGTLVVAYNQSYTGPTAINGGIVQLGSGATDRFQNGGQFITVNSNGITSTPFTGNVLTLTDGNNGEARSAFYDAPLNVASPFTASFVYQAGGNLGADGVTLIFQNDSRGLNALGAAGGGFGYSGISPSAAVQLNLYTGAAGGQGTTFATSGVIGTNSFTSPVVLSSGDPIQVNLSYDGSNNLVETLTDLSTSSTFSKTYPVGSLASTVSGRTAYVGFTGATGGVNSIQSISDFQFTTAGASNILPAATALSISGGTLDMFGANQTVASLSGPGTVTNSTTSAVALTVSPSSTSNFSGTLQDGAAPRGLALVLDGPGELILSGTNTYTGGTSVLAGTLVVASATALADGSSLAVGQGASSLFAPAVAGPAVEAASAGVVAVPEPGTLMLLLAALVGAATCYRFSARSRAVRVR